MSIKLGNLDVESFKVGSGDCSIYLGTTLLYSGGTPSSTQWSSGSSGIPNGWTRVDYSS